MLQDNALHPGSNRQGRNLFAPAVTAAAGLSSAEDVAEVRSSLLASVQKAGELKSFRDTLREEQEQHRQRVKRQGN